MRLLRQEMIQPDKLDGRNCHASQCLLLRDGRLFAVWFEGTREGADDVCIYGAFRTQDGWQPKRRVSPDDGEPHWNPVLFEREDGKILLFYKKGRKIPQWYTMVCESDDLCESFSEPRELVPGDRGGRGPVRNKIIRLSDGMYAAPASDEGFMWTAFVDLSADGSKWTASNRVNIFHRHEKPFWPHDRLLDKSRFRKRRGVIQPTLWESEPGRVHALLRSTEGFIYRMDSADCGKTWCRPYKTGLPNNNSGIDLVRLPDGRLLLVYNPVGDNWGARNPLSLAVSPDNGETWEKCFDLAREEGKHEFSYPCIITDGKKAYITYTYDRINTGYCEIEV